MREMTKRERVLAALQGKEVDYVPVSFWKHVAPEFWADEDFVREQAEFYRQTDVDFVKLSADKYFYWPSPVLKEINSAKELYSVKPIGASHPFIGEQICRTKKVVEAIRDIEDCCCFYLVFCPISYLRLTIGYPKMMQFIREEPEAMKYACDVIAEDVKYLVKGIIEEAGCDGIFYSVQNGERSRFTYDEYRSWITPSDKKVLDYANTLSQYNILHCCGWEGEANRLELWDDYKTAAVSWARFVEDLDIKEAKERFGRTVWGGFDNRTEGLLYTGTKEEIEAEVKRQISVSEKRGFMIGPDCSIHDELPVERIRWVVDMARQISKK